MLLPGSDLIGCERGFIAIHQDAGQTVRYRAFPARCNSWDCPVCARIKADRYKVRMRPLFDRPELYLYTLTFYHKRPPSEVWAEVSVAWNRLRTAATKKYGRISYVRVLEHHHKSPYPHLHCLIDKRFDDTWLNKELLAAGFGYQARVEQVTTVRAVDYVSKYLTKPWTDVDCCRLRKTLHLRIVTFGGDAVLPVSRSGVWGLITMALDCSGAFEAINTDVLWRCGPGAVKTYEETHADYYELTIAIAPERHFDAKCADALRSG